MNGCKNAEQLECRKSEEGLPLAEFVFAPAIRVKSAPEADYTKKMLVFHSKKGLSVIAICVSANLITVSSK